MMDAKFFDSLYEGDSANGIRLGMGITGGDFWPRTDGCSVLYRGSAMNLIDFTNLMAVAEMDSSEISPPYYIPHDNNSTYFYVLRRINGCGHEEHTLTAAVKVSIGSSKELVDPQPNCVFEARTEQVDGSKVRIVWYYCPIEQQSPPAYFNVYYDAGTGQIDYGNPIATINYSGRMFYSYTSDILDAGKNLFAIRIEDTFGTENTSLALIKVELYSRNPIEINILSSKTI
jgi:hypothetical protein